MVSSYYMNISLCGSCIILLHILFLTGNISCSREEKVGDKLSSELSQLAISKDPEGFAKERSIPLDDTSVRVIVEIADDFFGIKGRYRLKEIKRYKRFIEADVHIKDLIPLSREKGIRYIRRPRKFKRLR